MKTTLLIMILAAPLMAGEPDGFRGIKWGAPPNGLVRVDAKQGNDSAYSRPGEKLSIGPAELNTILYMFYKSQLSGVFAGFRGETNFDRLRETLTATFGDPTRTKDEITQRQLVWIFDSVLVALTYEPIRDSGNLIYSYRPLQEQKSKDEQEAARKASGDL